MHRPEHASQTEGQPRPLPRNPCRGAAQGWSGTSGPVRRIRAALDTGIAASQCARERWPHTMTSPRLLHAQKQTMHVQRRACVGHIPASRSLRRSTGPTHTPNSSHGPRWIIQYGEQSCAQMRMPQWQLRGVCRVCRSARQRAGCMALAWVCHRRSGSCRNSLEEPSVCESAGLARRARFCAGSRWRLDSNNSQHVPQ